MCGFTPVSVLSTLPMTYDGSGALSGFAFANNTLAILSWNCVEAHTRRDAVSRTSISLIPAN